MWWTVAWVVGWVVLAVLAGLVLTRFLARLSFELDPVTGERSLSKSSHLGKYYGWLCLSSNYYTIRFWWENLNVCTVGSRVFWRTVALLVGAFVVLVMLTGFFTLPFGIYKHGWLAMSNPANVSAGVWMKIVLIIGIVSWCVVILVVGLMCLGLILETIDNWVWKRSHRQQLARKAETDIPRESLLAAWLKSARERVCYRVKVVE